MFIMDDERMCGTRRWNITRNWEGHKAILRFEWESESENVVHVISPITSKDIEVILEDDARMLCSSRKRSSHALTPRVRLEIKAPQFVLDLLNHIVVTEISAIHKHLFQRRAEWIV
jgi:hypothetical protein